MNSLSLYLSMSCSFCSSHIAITYASTTLWGNCSARWLRNKLDKREVVTLFGKQLTVTESERKIERETDWANCYCNCTKFGSGQKTTTTHSFHVAALPKFPFAIISISIPFPNPTVAPAQLFRICRPRAVLETVGRDGGGGWRSSPV